MFDRLGGGTGRGRAGRGCAGRGRAGRDVRARLADFCVCIFMYSFLVYTRMYYMMPYIQTSITYNSTVLVAPAESNTIYGCLSRIVGASFRREDYRRRDSIVLCESDQSVQKLMPRQRQQWHLLMRNSLAFGYYTVHSSSGPSILPVE